MRISNSYLCEWVEEAGDEIHWMKDIFKKMMIKIFYDGEMAGSLNELMSLSGVADGVLNWVGGLQV